MIESAVEHGTILRFRQPLARNLVRFSLLSASADLTACTLVYWKRSEPDSRFKAPMFLRYDDGCKAEWRADVSFSEEVHYIKYFFVFTDCQGRTAYYDEHGFFASEPQAGFFELLQVNESDVASIPEWAKGCVYYQIFPERFAVGNPNKRLHSYEEWHAQPTRENYLGGDLRGMYNHLTDLHTLGVECLYLNPIFAGDFNHKYATTDYYRVDEDFGTLDDLIAFVKEAHRLNIRVVLDGVFNHVGVHFAPFADLRANGTSSRYRDWFYPKRFPIELSEECYECVGDYPYMPRLRVANPEVRAYIADVLLYWLDTAGIDGWRFDVGDELDAPAVRAWRETVKAKHPDALMLAETWGDASRLVCEGDQFDCAMNYLFRDVMVDYFAKGRIDEPTLDRRLQHMLMKYPDAVNLAMYNCLGSHDTARFLTECGGDLRRMKLAVAFQMTFLGSPAAYYGDEVGMTGENDPGCRGGMRWDALSHELCAWTRDMIALRKAHPALRLGDYRTVLADADRHLFAFERRFGAERALIALNLGDAPQSLDFAEIGRTVDILPLSVEIVIQ